MFKECGGLKISDVCTLLDESEKRVGSRSGAISYILMKNVHFVTSNRFS